MPEPRGPLSSPRSGVGGPEAAARGAGREGSLCRSSGGARRSSLGPGKSLSFYLSAGASRSLVRTSLGSAAAHCPSAAHHDPAAHRARLGRRRHRLPPRPSRRGFCQSQVSRRDGDGARGLSTLPRSFPLPQIPPATQIHFFRHTFGCTEGLDGTLCGAVALWVLLPSATLAPEPPESVQTRTP